MKRFIYSILVFVVVLHSCSRSDDGASGPPELNYNQSLTASFFTAGSSAAPTVNWNGDQGQFGLQNVVEGVSIDRNTGVISWTKDLALGVSEVTVLAFNNAGTASETVTIENQFQGDFSGTYTLEGTTRDLDLNFAPDNTAVLKTYGLIIREMTGTWTREDNVIKGDFDSPDEMLIYIIDGTLGNAKTGEIGSRLAGKFGVGNNYAGVIGVFAAELVEE